uniref:FecR family protein n=1 Tax=uncultured Draconibacterium sp. TaxID=1573823 RepID=UPI003217A5E7
MSSFKENIFEDLISDDQFIEWASGRDKSNNNYWNEWKAKHPEYSAEFEEAQKVVQRLNFNAPVFTVPEVKYQWNKTQSMLDKPKAGRSVNGFFRWFGSVAAVLLIPVVVTLIWFYQKNINFQTELEQVVQYSQENPVSVNSPWGSLVNLELPDGTLVWLNAGSEIKYPASFSEKQRKVSIKGEAFFEVEKAGVPFIVENGGPQVRVYGTQFNVNSYENEENVIVALAEGKVSLNVNGEEQFLKPGEISIFNKEKRSLLITEADIDQYISWRSGKLIFRNTTLEAMSRTLERRYNVNITIRDAEVAKYIYNAIIRGETFEQVLDLLTLTAPIKYTYHKPKQNADTSFTRAEVIIVKDKNRIVTK